MVSDLKVNWEGFIHWIPQINPLIMQWTQTQAECARKYWTKFDQSQQSLSASNSGCLYKFWYFLEDYSLDHSGESSLWPNFPDLKMEQTLNSLIHPFYQDGSSAGSWLVVALENQLFFKD